MIRVLLLGLLALLAACSTSSLERPSLSRAELLEAAPAATPSGSAAVSAVQALGLDDQMRRFVAEHTEGVADPGMRLRRLLKGMAERGLFTLEYAQTDTRTARATFHERRGNCLSFTMLFVALAREAGLDVSYQLVDVPPTWSNTSGLVIVSNHINARVNVGSGFGYVVDFNERRYTGLHDAREVSDRYALALFYNNLGAEAMIRKEYELAALYLRKSIETYPAIADPWTNLGLLFFKLEQSEHAESAYLHALAANPRDRSTLTNLVSLHTALGDVELAAAYRERIGRYQRRNPYFHFAAAEAAFDEQRFEQSLAAVKQALRLKRDDHRFHFLQGLAYLELGQVPQAERSFERALSHAEPEIGKRYQARIQALSDARRTHN